MSNTTLTTETKQLHIGYMHTDSHGWMVTYGHSRVSPYRCVTRKFGLGVDEARLIAQVLEVMGSSFETIEDDFRRVKPVVQKGLDLLRVRRAQKAYLPAWTQAQFENDIHFAACDAFEGKAPHFNFR